MLGKLAESYRKMFGKSTEHENRDHFIIIKNLDYNFRRKYFSKLVDSLSRLNAGSSQKDNCAKDGGPGEI